MSQEIKKALEAEGEEDFPMLLFPVIPVGLSTEHKNFCGSSQSGRTLTIISYMIYASAWRITVLKSWLFGMPWWECADSAGFKPGTSE